MAVCSTICSEMSGIQKFRGPAARRRNERSQQKVRVVDVGGRNDNVERGERILVAEQGVIAVRVELERVPRGNGVAQEQDRVRRVCHELKVRVVLRLGLALAGGDRDVVPRPSAR